MTCWRCQTVNPDTSIYCSKCGSPLTRRPRGPGRNNPWLVVAAGGLGLLGVAAVLFVVLSRRPPAAAPRMAAAGAEKAAAEEGRPLFTPGEVVIRDSTAVEISRLPAPVVGAAWLATPLWALFGGAEILYRSEDGPHIPLDRGYWNEGDPVILWKLPDDEARETSGFQAWRREAPLLWRPLSEEAAPLRVEVVNPQRRGFYLGFGLPAEAQKAGVLDQSSWAVGWTFGGQTERGYLWTGPETDDLVPNVDADQVFGAVVAGGREVGFYRAMALGEEADAGERLSAFAHGFRSAPVLGEDDLPFRYRTPSIVMQMHALASDLTQSGRAKDVLRILDEGILAEAAHPELVKDAVLAQASDQDYNRAIQYLGRLEKTVFEARGRGSSGLDLFRAQLYKDWLREILDKGGYFSAQVAYEEASRAFPDDPEIRLLGVEVALAENSLERAKDLLRARDVPIPLKDRADALAARIRTQEEEQALVIPFNPGAKQIFVEARLNGTYLQRFLIDTGATISSIPPETALALRIEVDQTTPVRAVTTASGVVLVFEVFLSSVDIMGYRAENMKVVVLEMLGDLGYGILGMDFLNNFRYEIDNQAGVFRLRKK